MKREKWVKEGRPPGCACQGATAAACRPPQPVARWLLVTVVALARGLAWLFSFGRSCGHVVTIGSWSFDSSR